MVSHYSTELQLAVKQHQQIKYTMPTKVATKKQMFYEDVNVINMLINMLIRPQGCFWNTECKHNCLFEIMHVGLC